MQGSITLPNALIFFGARLKRFDENFLRWALVWKYQVVTKLP